LHLEPALIARVAFALVVGLELAVIARARGGVSKLFRAAKRNPHGLQCGYRPDEVDDYRLKRRLAKPPIPSNPVTSKLMVPGSGTTLVGGPFVANPVSGPQLVPEAVQK